MTVPKVPGFRPFPIKELQPLLPYTRETALACLKRPFARFAWVIVIRGAGPWEGASSGAFCEDSELPFAAIDNEIKWSEKSLREFWDYLGQVRTADQVGNISLAFNASSNDSDAPMTDELELDDCDHIKVYHDAALSLYVRHVLHAWAYTREMFGTMKRKKMPLRGARLTLVDEMDQGILVC